MDTSNSAKISVSDMEETRMKIKTARCIQHSLSSAMAEALYQPHSMIQPKPFASRVKDAGKEFLRHNQTCQWIQFMQEPPETMDNKRDKQHMNVIPCRQILPVSVKEVELLAPPLIEPPPPPPSPPSKQQSPSYEEQLVTLHRQQEELMVQQRHLEDQMELEKLARQILPIHDLQQKPHETPEVTITPAVSPVKQRVDDKGANNCPPTRFRRRLKGSIAQSYAERDEGSIGSLLYNKGQETRTDKKSDISSTCYRRYARPSVEGRHYAIWQESGSNISQLMSQMPSSCDSVRHRHASESSGTITDTLLTELTIDERKGGHGDF